MDTVFLALVIVAIFVALSTPLIFALVSKQSQKKIREQREQEMRDQIIEKSRKRRIEAMAAAKARSAKNGSVYASPKSNRRGRALPNRTSSTTSRRRSGTSDYAASAAIFGSFSGGSTGGGCDSSSYNSGGIDGGCSF